MSKLEIRQVPWSSDGPIRQIRQQVFVEEQQVPAELEWDADDATAIHFLLSLDGQPVGTARLLPDGHIGRVAIVSTCRGQGLGARLMQHVMAYARSQGFTTLLLSAQLQALPFYTRLGFSVSSEEYMEAGIAHREMRWTATDELPPIEFDSPGRFSIHNPDTGPAERYRSALPEQLGQDSDAIELNEDNAVAHLCHLILQSRLGLRIYHADLLLWLCHQRRVIDCLEQRIASESRFQLQVLLEQVPDSFTQGHSLVQLLHRFPSRVAIRQQHAEREADPQAYCLVDQCGLLMLPLPREHAGFVRYNSRDQVKRWQGRFSDCWESAQTPASLRRFNL